MYISEKLYKLDFEGRVVVDRLRDKDDALKNIRVAESKEPYLIQFELA